MADVLSYAPPKAWHRQRRWILILTLPVLLLGYTLALPHYRTLRQHQVRRVEIRQQFEAKLENARIALDQGQLVTAAQALLGAEFPVRTEQGLFWSSEVEGYKKQIEPLKVRMAGLAATERIRFEELAAEAQKRLKEDDAREVSEEGYSSRCYIDIRYLRTLREGTLEVLNVRARELMRKHDNVKAFAICRQIVDLEPDHVFDDQFWANALLSR